jgi:hypothetical protein
MEFLLQFVIGFVIGYFFLPSFGRYCKRLGERAADWWYK